jgi:hypothetical protein
MGHEERFPSPSLSGRCRLGEATFAGMGGKEEDAPTAAIRTSTPGPPRSTQGCPSGSAARRFIVIHKRDTAPAPGRVGLALLGSFRKAKRVQLTPGCRKDGSAF